MPASDLSEHIEPSRFNALLKLEQAKEVKWAISEVQICPNCQKNAREYQLFNSGNGVWEKQFFCNNCGFDSWVESAWWFNFNMNVLGGV